MIKIETPNLDKIATNYFDKIKTSIICRCDYYLTVLDVIFNHRPYIDLRNHKLHGTSKKTLANYFLFQNKLVDQNQYFNVAQANCHPWVATYQDIFREISTYLKDETNLKELLTCAPNQAIKIEENIKVSVGITNASWADATIKFTQHLIDYDLFDSYAYNLANEIGINTCPYCNRNYINTIIDKSGNEIIRPTFDHFYPQYAHPFLALSFFNLIPSCYFCNSNLKSVTVMNMLTHIHPYQEGFDEDCTFHVLIKACKPNKSDPRNYSLFFKDHMTELSTTDRYRRMFGGTRAVPDANEGNINLFKLTEIYQSHLDIVGELVVKCDVLSAGYSDSLHKMFGLLHTNKSEFYQYYFGNYFSKNDFHRRPMAKLSKDVVSQILPTFLK